LYKIHLCENIISKEKITRCFKNENFKGVSSTLYTTERRKEIGDTEKTFFIEV
jgi:hypothetical protein